MAKIKQSARGVGKPPNPRSESSSNGPNKRPRTDEWDEANSAADDEDSTSKTDASDASVGPARTRDEEFWFEDGNIILVAGDVEFRVFKSILAEHSPVFSDMFSLPQPPSTPGSSANPCPVVYLSDSPEDLRHILRVSMPKSGTSPFAYKPSYHMLSATLRLGHKYQMHDLVKHGVRYLRKWFTSDLATWEDGPLDHDKPFEHIYAIGVVNLARLLDEPLLLPTALLTCCTLGADIVKGFDREDGTHESLSLDDLGRCIQARSRLVEHAVILAATVFSPPVSDGCSRPQQCREALRSALANLKRHRSTKELLEADIFSGEVAGLGWGNMGQCANCLEMARRRDSEQRESLWKLLPLIMGVDDVLDSDSWSKASSE